MFLFLVIFGSTKVYKVSNFQGHVFKFYNLPSGIYEVDVGLNDQNLLMAAYGDFNGDKS